MSIMNFSNLVYQTDNTFGFIRYIESFERMNFLFSDSKLNICHNNKKKVNLILRMTPKRNKSPTTPIFPINVCYYSELRSAINVLLMGSFFTTEISIGCSDTIEHT